MTRASPWVLASLTLLCLAGSAAALGAGVEAPLPAPLPAVATQVEVPAVQVPQLPALGVKVPDLRVGVDGDGSGSNEAAPALVPQAGPGPQVVAATAAVGAGTLLAAIVGLFLFSRIGDGRLLENEVRQRVLETIRDAPGVCIGDVQNRTGVAWGTAVYHLHRLERSGVVVSVRQGGARRYFAANTPVSRHRTGIAALAHPTAQRIASFVHRNPGTDQSGVCRELGLQNPAASKHLGRFESLGLVTAQRAGRSRLYQGTQALGEALTALSLPAV